MTDLWLVLTIMGSVSATWGPLPYDMQDCQLRIPILSREIDKAFSQTTTPFKPRNGKDVTRSDVRVGCFYLDKKPGLGDQFQEPRQ